MVLEEFGWSMRTHGVLGQVQVPEPGQLPCVAGDTFGISPSGQALGLIPGDSQWSFWCAGDTLCEARKGSALSLSSPPNPGCP
ncbi:hypothetical protein AV530_003081 [Patagioenas fasciata monilis]|uniref:Uncharacterized protein n=1 Tax=Patagioenas fasciata monilis TaxID=372326 RepID=A0A1V4KVU9_PATFA|nr:hypothetical protein AV530_003081 [Patagioenas fasciata monilis]